MFWTLLYSVTTLSIRTSDNIPHVVTLCGWQSRLTGQWATKMEVTVFLFIAMYIVLFSYYCYMFHTHHGKTCLLKAAAVLQVTIFCLKNVKRHMTYLVLQMALKPHCGALTPAVPDVGL